MLANKVMGATSAAPDINYIEDVFSTYLYTGNGATQTINNGIDLAGKGGLTWFKSRASVSNHFLFDSARGTNKYVRSQQPNAEGTSTSDWISSFNSNGFSLGSNAFLNTSSESMVNWTFRKQPKFFDVVTYTGDGVSGRTVAHSLGSVPGAIFVKATSATSDWQCSVRTGDTTYASFLSLNTTAAAGYVGVLGSPPTATEFTTNAVGTNSGTNTSGVTYVAYIFAHNAGGFGLSGNENVVSCGSFTTDGSGNATVNLGYEPQWIMYRRSASTDNWRIVDSMRGLNYSNYVRLSANLADVEADIAGDYIHPTATGFVTTGAIGASTDVIYIAIRRGPMKVPTLGTSVFKAISTPPSTTVTAGFVPDFAIAKQTDNGVGNSSATYAGSRLQGNGAYLAMSETSAEGAFSWQWNDPTNKFTQASSGTPTYSELFARAPSFMDVVCYTGNGSTQTIAHNLTVVPELIIAKNRTVAGNNWPVLFNFAPTTMNYGFLNLTNSYPNDTYANVGVFSAAPTSTNMFLTNSGSMNASGSGIAAYLFATCPGVSKVGSYTGTGTTQAIACGFTAGARFVMIKRTDSTGGWYYWDSARGIVAGSDPYLLLNSTAAEVTGTDYIDPSSAGFEISSTAPAAINASGGSYIFLAVA